MNLPPHISLVQGQYYNSLTNRFIRKEKIEAICAVYWENQGVYVANEVKIITARRMVSRTKVTRALKLIYHPPERLVVSEPIKARFVEKFSDRVNELVAAGIVKVMTWDEYQQWKKGR